MLTVPARAPFSWAADLHYSQAVAAGDLIFTAGQGGFGADGSVVDGGFEPQLRQTFANLRQALENDGATLDSVAKLTVYLLDASDYETFKRVRSDLFSAPYPASTAICVAALLVAGMRVEIDAVAVRGERRSMIG
jgi:2-iminobutanoate/2-iminopropanoate deaminase